MLRSLRNLLVLLLCVAARPALAQSGGELHFCLHGEPKTFNPILVDDEPSENIRYLTGGVLIRLNRQTRTSVRGRRRHRGRGPSRPPRRNLHPRLHQLRRRKPRRHGFYFGRRRIHDAPADGS